MHPNHSNRTTAPPGEALLVELRLEAKRFPARASFMPLVERVARLGRLDCIELALGPDGGGRLGFLVYGARSISEVRSQLASLVGVESIVRCKAWAA
ncbi:MAG TPA: hypothetical protein VN598_10335 [Usitatibacter sp.]|nr:hypothetical protein [Usitatibacter sp.]